MSSNFSSATFFSPLRTIKTLLSSFFIFFNINENQILPTVKLERSSNPTEHLSTMNISGMHFRISHQVENSITLEICPIKRHNVCDSRNKALFKKHSLEIDRDLWAKALGGAATLGRTDFGVLVDWDAQIDAVGRELGEGAPKCCDQSERRRKGRNRGRRMEGASERERAQVHVCRGEEREDYNMGQLSIAPRSTFSNADYTTPSFLSCYLEDTTAHNHITIKRRKYCRLKRYTRNLSPTRGVYSNAFRTLAFSPTSS